ncbi:hypothetical protein GH714_031650 [Hevea brasiliensis]|uniref:RRM domain-containing protein n=1 Tax=Hevea brasiliensis TaxID=3981 RepID=A0A6A6LFL1_HEVBR|nr:hypothetical protein GH714_031650 [Hevea brasiliensis]
MTERLSVQLEIQIPSEYPMIDTFVARCLPMSAYSGGQSARPISGVPSRPVDDSRVVGIGRLDPGATVKDRTMGLGSGRPEAPLPPDATSTLFVEGLPSDCTRREVSRILQLASMSQSYYYLTLPF